MNKIIEKATSRVRSRKPSPGGSTSDSKTLKNQGSNASCLNISSTNTLGYGNLRCAVALPEGEDLNEWIAYHISDFYKQTTMLYGAILPKCTTANCPTMSAGKHCYLWQEVSGSTPKPLPAAEYVDNLMTWINELLEDEKMFPSAINLPFPAQFRDNAYKIIKRLFRVYAHIYLHHLQDVREMKMEPHLNSSFKHFIFFVQEFQLISTEELKPLQEVIDVLTKKVPC